MNVVEKHTFEDEATATDFFILAKCRLLDVNLWMLFAGSELSKFQLTNTFGLYGSNN